MFSPFLTKHYPLSRTFEQTSGAHFQCFRYLFQMEQCDVSVAQFDIGEIAAVHVAEFQKVLMIFKSAAAHSNLYKSFGRSQRKLLCSFITNVGVFTLQRKAFSVISKSG